MSLSNLLESSPSFSNLLDDACEYIPSQESTSSLFVPHHKYNLRNLPSRTPNIDTSTLNFSTLSSNSALRVAGQRAESLTSDTQSSDFAPQSYFRSGLDTASLLSSDVQTAFLSGNLSSEVLIPTPVPPQIRLPENYTTEHSRPPTSNFADYP